jgi:carboxyl-terminal processing protease
MVEVNVPRALSGVIILLNPTVPRFRHRFVQVTALLLVGTMLAACMPGTGASTGGNRIVTPPPAPRDTPTPGGPEATPAPAAASTRIRGSGLSASELYAAYRAILDTYVDPVDQGQLIRAATESLQRSLQDQVSLPLTTLPVRMLPQPTGNPERDWQAFGDAYDAVVSKLPDWAERSHPDWIVLRGMTESLADGHTSFLTPDEARRRHETSFAGIGVLLSRPQADQAPLIAEIFPNSPASTSGLKRGDRILAVDGQDVTGKTVGDIAQLIRGAPRTDVKLQVRRLSSPQPLEFTLQRAQVQVEQVVGRPVPNTPIGYLRVRSFADESIVQQVLGILDQGRQRQLRGWIVDLRGNPGGSLRAVLAISGGFFDASQPVLGYQVDRNRRQLPLEIPQPLNLTRGQAVVVLIDQDSASGAEILAAALQEAKVATLVGSKTAGNVAVATEIALPDQSVLQVTERRFVSPGGAQLDGIGVTPDVIVELTGEDLEKDQDPQLGKALEVLIQKMTAPAG